MIVSEGPNNHYLLISYEIFMITERKGSECGGRVSNAVTY